MPQDDAQGRREALMAVAATRVRLVDACCKTRAHWRACRGPLGAGAGLLAAVATAAAVACLLRKKPAPPVIPASESWPKTLLRILMPLVVPLLQARLARGAERPADSPAPSAPPTPASGGGLRGRFFRWLGLS